MRDAMEKLLEGRKQARPKGKKSPGDGMKIGESVTVSLQNKEVKK